MEEIYKLSQYFPLSAADRSLKSYVDHHFKHLVKCSEYELYSSAYPHLHILYMTFIYIQILRIAKEKSEEFELCWIGFPNQEKDFLKDPSSPFSFSKINEKTVFRFFRLIGFDDGTIGGISHLVNRRNDRLHANGEIFPKQAKDFEYEFSTYLAKMYEVIDKQKSFLGMIYQSLIENYEEDFEMTQDEIGANFSAQYYFSEYELKMLAEGNTDIVSKFIMEKM